MNRTAVVALALLISPSLSAEVLTNGDVIALSKAGLGDEAVVAKIKSSDASFDLTTSQLIALKNAGISGPVIAAMLSASAPKATPLSLDAVDPMQPHATGVYVLREADHRMERMDPTATNQAKTGGHIGHIMTFGISTMSIKAAIPGESARVKIPAGLPIFYFFFDESNGAGSGSSTWASGTNAVVTSPSEFTLVHLNKKESRREAQVGSTNIGGTKNGVMDHDRIEFDYTLVRPGVYRAMPGGPLKPGEYGFIYAISGAGAAGALTARVYDFAVPGSCSENCADSASVMPAPAAMTATPIAHVSHPASVPVGSLPIYVGDADRRYQIIGAVQVAVANIDPNKPAGQAKIFGKLWDKAKAMGADAVIHATIGEPHMTAMVARKMDVSGIAIKFEAGSATEMVSRP